MVKDNLLITDSSQFIELAGKISQDFEKYRTMDYSLFDFNLEPIIIKILGTNYDSTIDTQLMKACLNLQKLIYDCYSLAVYNYVKPLNTEEKLGLTLYIKVEKGCSLIKILTNKVLGEVVKKMNGTQALAAIAIIVIGLTTGTIYSKYTTIKLKEIEQTTMIKARESESRELMEYSTALKEITLLTLDTQKYLLETLSNIDGTILIQDKPIDKREFDERIQTITEVKKEIQSEIVCDEFEIINKRGNFKITNISIPLNSNSPYIIAIKDKDKTYRGIVLAEHGSV